MQLALQSPDMVHAPDSLRAYRVLLGLLEFRSGPSEQHAEAVRSSLAVGSSFSSSGLRRITGTSARTLINAARTRLANLLMKQPSGICRQCVLHQPCASAFQWLQRLAAACSGLQRPRLRCRCRVDKLAFAQQRLRMPLDLSGARATSQVVADSVRRRRCVCARYAARINSTAGVGVEIKPDVVVFWCRQLAAASISLAFTTRCSSARVHFQRIELDC